MPDALPQTLPFHLAGRIRQGIVSGRYPPGAALREQALEAEYGCSRGPVREALRLLDARGLLTHAPRHGFRVRAVDAAGVRQIYALRALLESHAVRGLEGRVSPALLAGLRDANLDVKRHRAAGAVERYLRANLDFHAVLWAHAPDEALRRALDLVNEMAEPLRHALLLRTLRESRAPEQHDAIVALLEAGRIADAAAAMHDHVLTGLPAALATVAPAPRAATGASYQ